MDDSEWITVFKNVILCYFVWANLKIKSAAFKFKTVYGNEENILYEISSKFTFIDNFTEETKSVYVMRMSDE